MNRTACFGFCPDYYLAVSGNGTVFYEGHRFVATNGKQTGQISSQQLEQLVRKSLEINYFGLEDKYVGSITDLPFTVTSVTLDNQSKRIVDYYGAPEKLKDFENLIDKITKSERWVKCPDEQRVMSEQSGCS